ncbi:MAG: sugar ABC transporter permease [Lachnospiraceae bacterium]|nr:sugar ABC transporter permease [Lachnospiraceae bacterium]
MQNTENKVKKKKRGISYAKWGYIFILPFFLTYFIWSFIPQVLTFIYSFFEMYKDGLRQIGPNFVGFGNYVDLFATQIDGVPTIVKYAGNTMIMWILGAVPQFLIALLLAVWFTNLRLNIKGQGFFKTVIYMPNLIMASAFSMLIWTIFNTTGPIHILLEHADLIESKYDFFFDVVGARGLVAGINFLMWFGNTTIVLMAGIMGIDNSLFEAALIDGASNTKIFFKITLPLLMPILTYAVITSLIGGINMYDVPYILSKGMGTPDNTTMTLIMLVQRKLGTAKNYGSAGAASVLVFIFSAILSLLVFKFLISKDGLRDNTKKGGKKR